MSKISGFKLKKLLYISLNECSKTEKKIYLNRLLSTFRSASKINS